jgi:hypothetical protein
MSEDNPECWEDFSPDMQEMIVRVGEGELTADEAREELQRRNK